MIKLFFFLITMYAFIAVIYIRFNGKKAHIIKDLIYDINLQYKVLVGGKSEYLTLWQWRTFLISHIFIVFSIIYEIFEQAEKYQNNNYIFLIKIIFLIIFIVVAYFIIGYFSMCVTRVYKYLYRIEDKNIKTDLLISYFLISMYLTILMIFPKQFKECYIIGLFGVSISYLLNLKVLLKIISSPDIVQSKNNKENNLNAVAIILLIMVLVSLYLAVCFISTNSPNSYTNNPSYFDLLYYTVITFTTIGYGDISPVSPSAKFLSMIISFTSVLCLTIFVSSILSYKEK